MSLMLLKAEELQESQRVCEFGGVGLGFRSLRYK